MSKDKVKRGVTAVKEKPVPRRSERPSSGKAQSRANGYASRDKGHQGKRKDASAPIGLDSIDALKAAPYNPRRIDDASLAGLGVSLSEFGDISGIVWNQRTEHLVAGHQRLSALRRSHGEGLRLEDGVVVTPAGERFPVRVVDWSTEKEKAANLAANNPHLAGSFEAKGLEDLLADLNTADSLEALFPALRLDELLPHAMDMIPGGSGGGTGSGSTSGDAGGKDAASGNTPAGGDNHAGTSPTSSDIEHLTFSVPLRVDQHQAVTKAIRLAREQHGGMIADGLFHIARHYLKEQNDA
jgi:hypothetical protein